MIDAKMATLNELENIWSLDDYIEAAEYLQFKNEKIEQAKAAHTSRV